MYNNLKLPLYDGLQQQLELHNIRRKEFLDSQKTESSKRKRIELKKQRTTEAQRRKEWFTKHGEDDYCSGSYDLSKVQVWLLRAHHT